MTEAIPAEGSAPSPFAGCEWFDPLDEAVRCQVRSLIEQLLEDELEAARGRLRYERGAIANGRLPRSWAGARRSWPSGGSAAGRSPRVWKELASRARSAAETQGQTI